MEKVKRWLIWQIDWLDDLAGHPFRGAFCNRIALSSWWGRPDFKCEACGFESHVGPRLQEYTVDPCPGCESGKRSAEWRSELHHAMEDVG